MSLRSYSEINLHIVWHVKRNAAVLNGAIEAHFRDFISGRITTGPQSILHAIGGTDDHVHVAVSIEPDLLISDWIGQLKGSSSHFINTQIANRKSLEWQTSYGVVAFGTKNLRWIVDYVKNQRKHHATGTTHLRLECIERDDEGNPVDPSGAP